MYPPFQANHFVLKKQVLALTGVFRLYDDSGSVIAYSKQKMFKLREDIRVFADESQTQEVLAIQARQIIDFAAAYDVYDSQEGQLIGTLRRRGFRSMVRDEWDVLSQGDAQIGTLMEDSIPLAMLRRLLVGRLLPQNYDLLVGSERAMDLCQRFNFFRYELDLEFMPNVTRPLDHRLGIAAGILLGAIEGKQES